MIFTSQEQLITTERQQVIHSFVAPLLLEKRGEFNFGRGFGRLSGGVRKCKKSLEVWESHQIFALPKMPRNGPRIWGFWDKNDKMEISRRVLSVLSPNFESLGAKIGVTII